MYGFLRYLRFRFFTFLFVIPKIFGNSSSKNNKSCRIFLQQIQQNWVCIFLIFLRFSTNFQIFSKSRRDRFTNRPSNFADRPSGRKFRFQLGPWRHGRWWELNSGEGKARLGRERVGECLGAHLRPIPGVGRLRGRAGEGARRHQPPVAAASSPPAKLRRGRANTRH
jgi:hypothetical protein